MVQLPSSITTRLQYQHKSLLDLIEGLTDEQIRRPLEQGKWSIFETIVHLTTYQHIFNARLRQILDGNDPKFERYTAEADPMFHDNCGKSSREIIQDLLTTRKEMSSEIVHFDPADFSKTGAHPAYGKMNIIQWLNFFLLHEAHHLFAIFKLAASLRKR